MEQPPIMQVHDGRRFTAEADDDAHTAEGLRLLAALSRYVARNVEGTCLGRSLTQHAVVFGTRAEELVEEARGEARRLRSV